MEATREAFSAYFDTVEVTGISVSSNVSNQPIDDETFAGARNRAFELKNLVDKERNGDADFFVGIEGGLTKLFHRWFCFGVMCIMDSTGRTGYGTAPFFELPSNITEKVLKRDGTELGDAIDSLIGEKNTKEKQGAVGYFTNGVVDRKRYYVDGLLVALIPFLNTDLYFEPQISTE